MIRARHYANDALILTKQNAIFNELGKIKIKYANRAPTPCEVVKATDNLLLQWIWKRSEKLN